MFACMPYLVVIATMCDAHTYHMQSFWVIIKLDILVIMCKYWMEYTVLHSQKWAGHRLFSKALIIHKFDIKISIILCSPLQVRGWVVGDFFMVVDTFNHVGGSFSLFMATTRDFWIIPSFQIWGYVLHVELISCITNSGQHHWAIPSLFSITLEALLREILPRSTEVLNFPG